MGAVASPRSRARFAIRWGSAPSTIALVVALVALCAPSAASQQPRSLTDEDVRRFAALLRMTDARQQDSAVVRAALASRSSTLRAAGALAIGQARATSMLGSARALLSDPDTGVAAAAAFAIGLLRDSLSVVPLAAALSAPPTVAVEAAWALGQIGAPARAALERALARESRDARVTGALLLAAAKLRPVPVEWLGPYLRHASPEIRWRAAYVVARPFAAAGVRALLPLARDTSAMVRAQVARALSRAAAGDSLRALALPLLDSLARDPHPHTRIRRFPPRLAHQPIFYPVLNEAYAEAIARNWNTKDVNSQFCGFVTQFSVDDDYGRLFPVQVVGDRNDQELWVPAEELNTFNRHIQGNIHVLSSFYGDDFSGKIDSDSNLPTSMARSSQV
jgi:HEAT repeat protein